jgi:dipeptidyl-peptidase 4
MKNTILFVLIIAGLTFAFAQDSVVDNTLTVKKIWADYEFFPSGVEGFRSMNDGEHFTKFSFIGKFKSIVKYSFTNRGGAGEVLVNGKDLVYNGKQLSVTKYDFNADESKVLLVTNEDKQYRRSYFADYFLYDLSTQTLAPLDETHRPQMLASYSPQGDQVAYIHANNLYVKDLKSNKVRQITKDGEFNKIINGTTDWVYEEEFAITKAYGWSPDGEYLAFLRFDESEVKEFTLTYHNELYPELYTFKYPKAGEDNSKVSLHIVRTKNGKGKKIDLGDYEYIPRLKWSEHDNKLMVLTLNRHQNHLKYHWIDATNKRFPVSVVYEEKDDAYVEIDDNLIFLADGKSFIRTSEKDGFNHIYKIGLDGSSLQLTIGRWDVVDFKGINHEKGLIYYTSAERGAIYKDLYVVDVEGNNKYRLSQNSGSNDAKFSTGMKYYVNTWSNANKPPVHSLHRADGSLIEILEDNEYLQLAMQDHNFQPKQFFTVKGADGDLNAWAIYPSGFNPKADIQYPVYFNVYCGPGSNLVKDSYDYNMAYHQLLAQNGYIVFCVDTRGTMYRGAKFKKSTYLQLGKLETEDLIAVAQGLQALPYVDGSRIGIMGWSYGGYMASLAMTKGADVFKMGIAVAPVTNWRYYDNIYTERFMRTPQENADGYDDNSPINHVEKIKGKYFIIHGDGDDNVHVQNTLEMVNAMINKDIDFDMYIYPNKDHGIYGGNTRNHLFRMLFEYTLKNL